MKNVSRIWASCGVALIPALTLVALVAHVSYFGSTYILFRFLSY